MVVVDGFCFAGVCVVVGVVAVGVVVAVVVVVVCVVCLSHSPQVAHSKPCMSRRCTAPSLQIMVRCLCLLLSCVLFVLKC